MGFGHIRRAIAERQVESGRRLIGRQRELIAENKARGLDAVAAGRLLASFERSQAIFEEEFAAIDGGGNWQRQREA